MNWGGLLVDRDLGALSSGGLLRCLGDSNRFVPLQWTDNRPIARTFTSHHATYGAHFVILVQNSSGDVQTRLELIVIQCLFKTSTRLLYTNEIPKYSL